MSQTFREWEGASFPELYHESESRFLVLKVQDDRSEYSGEVSVYFRMADIHSQNDIWNTISEYDREGIWALYHISFFLSDFRSRNYSLYNIISSFPFQERLQAFFTLLGTGIRTFSGSVSGAQKVMNRETKRFTFQGAKAWRRFVASLSTGKPRKAREVSICRAQKSSE